MAGDMPVQESVRLLIWDLDDTFWRGTISEGGMKEYLQSNHDIVIALASRGIMSSICSKNEFGQAATILERHGIFGYFIFPSISWEPKGVRIADLIRNVQLRPESVMFIDDNPNNRAEASATVPGIQTEDVTFLARLLDDARFVGKMDSDFSRLKQYKLLEARKCDERQAIGSNEAFLRGCDIRVVIEYDVPANIDRAIELINRTNQLNYTKRRLPENLDAARALLLREIDSFNRQAGLIRVVDKYGDYGFVGFFVLQNRREDLVAGVSDATLVHYCFSCRTLGMLVEQWVYEYLRRPALEVVGEVITDLTAPKTIDWVRLVKTADSNSAEQTAEVASEIVLGGGCEGNAMGVYLGAHASRISVFGSYAASGLFVHFDSAIAINDVCERSAREFGVEAETLGLPTELMANDIFARRKPGTAFVFNFSRDSFDRKFYRHKRHGWRYWFEPALTGSLDLVATTEDELLQRLSAIKSNENPELNAHVIRVARHLRNNYDSIVVDFSERVRTARGLIERTPSGSKFVIVMNHDEFRDSRSMIVRHPKVTAYTKTMRDLVEDYPFATVVTFSEVLTSPDEIRIGENHYTRPVFLRMSERIVQVLSELPPKP